MDAVRTLIKETAEQRGFSLKKLSEEIGKNHAYMQQFIERGIPRKLPERVRSRVSELLGIDEEALGAPASKRSRSDTSRPLLEIPQHDVRASAGHGTLIDDETLTGHWPFPRDYVRHNLALASARLAIIGVIGDSMAPTLHSGDQILVDLDDHDVENPGVFALYDGSATVVKRVEKIPGNEPVKLMLISDNPLHNNYPVDADLVNVAGRVVWFGRRL